MAQCQYKECGCWALNQKADFASDVMGDYDFWDFKDNCLGERA
jgi:hypothetical protein